MSFVRRSSSFAAVKKPDESLSNFKRSDSFADHDFFYDVEDMHVLKAGGLPKVGYFMFSSCFSRGAMFLSNPCSQL